MTAPTRATAAARIVSAYTKAPREHLGERLARSWQRDERMERLAGLREDPARWAALPNSSRVELALYLGARSAAVALGRDVSAPTADPS